MQLIDNLLNYENIKIKIILKIFQNQWFYTKKYGRRLVRSDWSIINNSGKHYQFRKFIDFYWWAFQKLKYQARLKRIKSKATKLQHQEYVLKISEGWFVSNVPQKYQVRSWCDKEQIFLNMFC